MVYDLALMLWLAAYTLGCFSLLPGTLLLLERPDGDVDALPEPAAKARSPVHARGRKRTHTCAKRAHGLSRAVPERSPHCTAPVMKGAGTRPRRLLFERSSIPRARECATMRSHAAGRLHPKPETLNPKP